MIFRFVTFDRSTAALRKDCPMTSSEEYEAIAREVCTLDRSALIDRLTHFDSQLPLDFSEEFLAASPTDRLRHILVAALWRCRMKELTASNY